MLSSFLRRNSRGHTSSSRRQFHDTQPHQPTPPTPVAQINITNSLHHPKVRSKSNEGEIGENHDSFPEPANSIAGADNRHDNRTLPKHTAGKGSNQQVKKRNAKITKRRKTKKKRTTTTKKLVHSETRETLIARSRVKHGYVRDIPLSALTASPFSGYGESL